ncbi:MAG: hypothetical protein ABI587_16310 [Gemmatimonadales bacterium]
MQTIKYKGFAIQAQPYQLHDTKRWTVDLEIWRGGQKQHFSLREHYQTEAEADARCSGVGRRIIDGTVRGYSVRHLPRRKAGTFRGWLVAGIILLSLAALSGAVGWMWSHDMTEWREWI